MFTENISATQLIIQNIKRNSSNILKLISNISNELYFIKHSHTAFKNQVLIFHDTF